MIILDIIISYLHNKNYNYYTHFFYTICDLIVILSYILLKKEAKLKKNSIQ